MRNIVLITAIILWSNLIAAAQDYYLKTVNVDNTASDNGLHIVTDEEGYAIMCGSLGKIGFVRTDLAGNKIWDNVFDYTYDTGVSDLMRLPNGNYLLAGVLGEAGMSFQDLFIFANADNGAAYREVVHGDEMDNRVAQVIMRNNQIVSFEGFSPPDDTPLLQTLLLTMDTAGTLLRRDTLPNVAGYAINGAAAITLLSSDEYVIGIGAQDSVTLKIAAYLRKIDTLGNTIWEQKINNTETTSPIAPIYLATLKDGNFVATWAEFLDDVLEDYATYFVRCYNSAGDSLWQYTFASSYAHNIQGLRVCANGDIIGVGYIGYHPATNMAAGWMFRLSPSGQLIWQREYVYWDALSQFMLLYDLAEDPYGDIIATGGAVLPDPVDGIWKTQAVLLKVNAMGCFGTGGCADTSIVY